MDGAAVRVLVEADQISFGGFLKGKNGLGLEAEISFVLLGNLTDEALERSLLDQEVGRLLILADLTQSDLGRKLRYVGSKSTRFRSKFVKFVSKTTKFNVFSNGSGTETMLLVVLADSSFATSGDDTGILFF